MLSLSKVSEIVRHYFAFILGGLILIVLIISLIIGLNSSYTPSFPSSSVFSSIGPKSGKYIPPSGEGYSLFQFSGYDICIRTNTSNGDITYFLDDTNNNKFYGYHMLNASNFSSYENNPVYLAYFISSYIYSVPYPGSTNELIHYDSYLKNYFNLMPSFLDNSDISNYLDQNLVYLSSVTSEVSNVKVINYSPSSASFIFYYNVTARGGQSQESTPVSMQINLSVSSGKWVISSIKIL